MFSKISFGNLERMSRPVFICSVVCERELPDQMGRRGKNTAGKASARQVNIKDRLLRRSDFMELNWKTPRATRRRSREPSWWIFIKISVITIEVKLTYV